MSKELKVRDKVQYVGDMYKNLNKGVIDNILPHGTYRYLIAKSDSPFTYPCSADELEIVE